MRILGIETSCDETALAIVEGRGERVRVVRELVASQVKIHKKYGGVVPEVAARQHAEVMPYLLEKFLGSGLRPSSRSDLPRRSDLFPGREKAFDVIAVTAGPGLITSLRVGVDTARALAYAWGKPLVAVNHLEGHIHANWLDLEVQPPREVGPRLPALALVVSGGHTELVLMRYHGDYELLGATRDDAAGEAFDKVGKLLSLGYPGGPAVAKLAEKGNPRAIAFPRPMINSKDFDFSFSGLKTAVAQYVENNSMSSPRRRGSSFDIVDSRFRRNDKEKNGNDKKNNRQRFAIPYAPYPTSSDICASFQEAVVDVLVAKTMAAAKKVKPKTILLAGGVAANSRLRQALGRAIKDQLPTTSYILPTPNYATDNAAMIAAAGYFLARKKRFADWRKLDPMANWEIGEPYRSVRL